MNHTRQRASPPSPSTTASRCRPSGSASSRPRPTRPSPPSRPPSQTGTGTSTPPRRTATSARSAKAIAALRARPRRGLRRDQGLDQRLRVRRHPARLRQERRQARARPDRPADPPPGAAEPVRPHHRGLPGAGDAAGRRQGPRHRRQQLHARPPGPARGRRHRDPGGQPDRGPPLLPPARRARRQRRARHPHPGLVPHRRHHLLPRRQHGHPRWRTPPSSRSPRPTARRPPR